MEMGGGNGRKPIMGNGRDKWEGHGGKELFVVNG